jgi:hypothetical protein
MMGIFYRLKVNDVMRFTYDRDTLDLRLAGIRREGKEQVSYFEAVYRGLEYEFTLTRQSPPFVIDDVASVRISPTVEYRSLAAPVIVQFDARYKRSIIRARDADS